MAGKSRPKQVSLSMAIRIVKHMQECVLNTCAWQQQWTHAEGGSQYMSHIDFILWDEVKQFMEMQRKPARELNDSK